MSQKQGKKLPQYVAALSVCLGSVAAGAVLGWTSNIVLELKAGEYNDIPLTEDDFGWVGSLATLGALTMCFPIGWICDMIGRKWAMLGLIVPFTLGWLLIIFADSVGLLFAGRFITGLAGGAFCISAPMYTSEIAEKEIRGALGSYFQLLLTVGILFAYIMAYAVDLKTYTIVCAVIPLIFGVVFFFQPETPVYLVKKGKEAEAKKSLRRLRGPDYDVDAEYEEIKNLLESDSKINTNFCQAIKKRATKKAGLIVFGLMFFQQLGGVNAVIFYTSDIFKAAGVQLDPKEATMIVGSMQVMATFVSSLIIDKLGRKILLMISGLMMALSSILLGVYFTLQKTLDKETVDDLGFLPIVALCLFMIVFSLGFGPIPWMISAEVYPPEVKTIGSSGAGTFNWLMAFLVTKYYPALNKEIEGDVFYIFGGISVVGAIFILFLVPETKGKSLEQIQRELEGKKSHTKGIDNEAFND